MIGLFDLVVGDIW